MYTSPSVPAMRPNWWLLFYGFVQEDRLAMRSSLVVVQGVGPLEPGGRGVPRPRPA